MRKVIALLATPGLVVAIYIFIASFFGMTMDKLAVGAFVLHLGIFVLAIPLVFLERQRTGVNPFRGKPGWVIRSMQLLGLCFFVIFFAFMTLSHVASPEIVDGQYVLNSHGKIVGHISERDYLLLKAWQLRLFASVWIFFYYAMMVNWWFPRKNEWTVIMPDK